MPANTKYSFNDHYIYWRSRFVQTSFHNNLLGCHWWLQSNVCENLSFTMPYRNFGPRMAHIGFCHRISIKLTEGLWRGHSKTFIFILLSPSTMEYLVSFRSVLDSSALSPAVRQVVQAPAAAWNDVSFKTNLTFYLPTTSTFDLSVDRISSQKVSGSSRCFGSMWDKPFCYFWQARCNSHMIDATFAVRLSYLESLTLHHNCGLQFFSVSKWRNLSRTAAPGKVDHCSTISLFVDNGSHCGSVESQRVGNGFISLSEWQNLMTLFLHPLHLYFLHVPGNMCLSL